MLLFASTRYWTLASSFLSHDSSFLFFFHSYLSRYLYLWALDLASDTFHVSALSLWTISFSYESWSSIFSFLIPLVLLLSMKSSTASLILRWSSQLSLTWLAFYSPLRLISLELIFLDDWWLYGYENMFFCVEWSTPFSDSWWGARSPWLLSWPDVIKWLES